MNWEKMKVRHTQEQRRTIFRNFRKELGCTQKEMGEYLKTPARTIERWETRSAPPEALIQMIIIKNELHDAIRERSIKIKELETEFWRAKLLTPNEKRFMVESLKGTELEDLSEDYKKELAELDTIMAEEDEREIMREVAEERCFGAEKKELM